MVGAAAKGLIWCFTFVILESVQAAFFGGLFQRMDSFLIGSLIFGLSTIGGIAWTYFLDPGQLTAAFRHPAPLIGMNVTADSLPAGDPAHRAGSGLHHILWLRALDCSPSGKVRDCTCDARAQCG